MDNRKDNRSSPRKSKKSSRPKRRSNTHGHREHRIIREQRTQKTACCHNTERCKGIGAVLFTLGIPASIAGIILTVVATTDDNKENKYPESFLVVGPMLLVLAVIFFSLGLCLYNPCVWEFFQRCFSLDNPKGFCRVHCKKLSHCLKPDDAIIINQAAMKALQTEPGRPVLKRGKLLSVTSESDGKPETENAWTLDETSGAAHPHHAAKGVRFSDSDADDKDNHSSSPDSGSVLSLRHCKVFPKSKPENIWWTDEVAVKEIEHEPKGMTRATEL